VYVQVAEYLVYAVAVLLLTYIAYFKDKNMLFRLFVFLVIAALFSYFENYNIALVLSGVLFFNALITSISNKYNILFVLLSIFFLFTGFYVRASTNAIALAMLLGFLSGIHSFSISHKGTHNKNIEIKRDIAQIILGAVFLLLFSLLGLFAASFIFIAILLLGTGLGSAATVYRHSTISKFLYSLERKDAVLGSGAFWLSAGTLLALSFINSLPYVLTIFAALFFGDSIATIAGMSLPLRRLTYNRKKSVAGTLSYFALVAFVSYFFIGFMALAFAAVAAFVESLDLPIDDNFGTSLALTLLAFILSL